MKFGHTRVLPVVPAISATPDYTAGDSIGGTITLAGLPTFGRGILKTLSLVDAANQKPVLTLMFFRELPTGTFTDNAAAAPSAADDANFIGKVNVAAADWETVNSKAYATLDLGQTIRADNARNLYVCIVITGGGLNFAAADDLKLALGLLLD